MFYIYDNITKEFQKEIQGQPNPLEDGKFFTPPFSTMIKPIEKKKNFTIIFNGTFWEYIDDYRGMEIYNPKIRTEAICDYLGVLVNGYSLGSFFEKDSDGKYYMFYDDDGKADTKRISAYNKSIEVAEQNKIHYEYLSNTDWYYARQIETGKKVPPDIVENRKKARDNIVNKKEK